MTRTLWTASIVIGVSLWMGCEAFSPSTVSKLTSVGKPHFCILQQERARRCLGSRLMSSLSEDDETRQMENEQPDKIEPGEQPSPITSFWNQLQKEQGRKRPPIQVEDQDVMFFDVFLLVNLSLSISFWVVHRMDISYLAMAFNEGCLLSVCWLLAGLWNGVFLNSAVDGHYGSSDERGGPKAAGLLALNTFVGTINLRLLFALVVAVLGHRHVGGIGGEEFMPLELGCGLLLMTSWRALHSSVTPRI